MKKEKNIITLNPYEGITLNFDIDKHKFTVNDKPVISVTTVTGIIDKSAPLIYWAVNLTKSYLQNLLNDGVVIGFDHVEEASKQHRIKKEAAAAKGTRVHEWAEDFISGKNPKIPRDDENVVKGIEAFLKWVNDTNIKFLESEKLIYSKKHNYAGITDLIAMVDDKLVVVDFKTSKRIYTEMRYQVAAYTAAYEEMTNKKVQSRWIIKFDKETGDFESMELKEQKKDFKAFLAALTIKRREQELK